MPRKPPLAQMFLFLMIVLLILLGSVGSTLYFKGVSMGEFTQEVGETLGLEYKQATLTDARLACEEELRRRFAKRLRVMHVDTLSSRRDEAENLYKIFIEAEIFADSDRAGAAREVFINCFTTIDRARIVSFQFAGDSLEDTGDGTGNYFGM